MTGAQVHVVFIDASTREPIGQTLMPLERLPASFEANTTMHIGGDDWTVVHAEPMTAAAFGMTGELKLTLAKVMRISPQAILYTLSTLCADLPPSSPAGAALGMHVFKLHEDDWRQIELVSVQCQDAVAAECEAIDRIFRQAGEFTGRFWGFRDIHIRRTIAEPLRPAIPMSQVLAALPQDAKPYDGVSFDKSNALVQESFAFGLGGLGMYGLHTNGLARILGVQRVRASAQLGPDAAPALARLMQTYHLYLVDWCSRVAVPAQEQAVRAYLLAGQ